LGNPIKKGGLMVQLLNLFFLSLFLVFPFGQLARFPLTSLSRVGVNIYLHDLIVGLMVVWWLIEHGNKREKFTLPPLAKPIMVFFGTAFLSWLVNMPGYTLKETLVAFLYLLRWLVYAGLYFLAWEKRRVIRYPIVKMLIAAGVASAVLGLLQYFFLPDTRFLFYSGWDRHYYRLIGSFLDPGFTGMIFVLTLILIVQKFRGKNFLRHLLLAVCYLGLALTYSRASYLAFIVGMIVLAWLKKSWQLFIVPLLVLLMTFILLPRPGGEGVKLSRSSSIESRVNNYQSSLKIIKESPFLGVGFNFYRYAQRDAGFLEENWQVSHAAAGADSSLFFVLATTGLVGFGFYFWLLWEIIKIQPASALALVAHSFFNHSLFYSWIMIWMWLLLGVKENSQE
jgi:hypothetical protein